MACYALTNCASGNTWNINYAPGGLSVGDAIAIAPDTSGELVNCWTVTGIITPCAGTESTVYSVTNYGIDNCTTCETTPKIYKLVSCDDSIVIYTYVPLGTFVNGYMGNVNLYTGECFYVTESITAPTPPIAITGSFATCTCIPCYRVQNCIDTSLIINISSAVVLPPAPNSFELSPAPTTPLVPVGTPNCWRLVAETPCTGSESLFTIITSYDTCDDCMLDKQCYALTKCGDLTPTIYTKSNLAAYVSSQITSTELSGNCYTVALSPTCIGPIVLNTTLITSCSCPPPGNCYLLTLCGSDGTITINVNITPPTVLTVGNVYNILPVPTIPPTYSNCWEVVGPITCEPGFYAVTSVNTFATCEACQAPPVCYKLTSCDGEDVIYSQSDLSLYVGGPPIATTLIEGKCWIVTLVPPDGDCTGPVNISAPSISYCTCPCYKLTNCQTGLVIYSNSDLAFYVGQNIHLDEYSGCAGDCWSVEISSGVCEFPITVTVSTGCDPCLECKPITCYPLIDCITKVPYITLSNPTSNGVNLSLNVGKVISKICTDAAQTACVYGCWEVGAATEVCDSAVLRYVYNIYDTCTICNNRCYEFVSCETGLVAYTILDEPNTYGLPPLVSLVGQTVTGLCFDKVCPPGCFYVRKKENGDCSMSTGYGLITTLAISPTFCCQDECYLVTPCDGSMEPFIVSNDLSAYVGEVINACFTIDGEQVCKCLQVIKANSCEDSIVLDTIIDNFETCEDCKYCGCPDGYTKVDDQCQKIVTVPAVLSPTVFTVTAGTKNTLYGSLGTRFYANISALPGPITQSGTNFLDAGAIALPFTTNTTGVWGPGLLTSRLNTVGVWTGAAPNPLNEWIGFTHCVTLAETGTYCVAVAGDNGVRFSLDGILLVNAPSNVQFNFEYWHVFELTLTAGTHVISVEGYNYGGAAAFGAEIYSATAALLQTFTTPAQVQNPAITVFSTFSKIGANFDIGQNSGYSCPNGYTLSLCDGTPECTGIQTTPFKLCPPTYKVTLCKGQGVSYDPIITNTDLSAYIGTFKVCVTNPTFSTSYFVLKDCNGIVPDICTITPLTSSLWESIVLIDYPGSCFIVNGVIQGQTCTNPVGVATVREPCVCTGAGTPWPNGCYCVTVEEIPSQIGIDFYGTFGEEFDCCDDCTQVCYLLTSCVPGINPITVCNDLSAYVNPGKVIKITGCGDICWNVAIAGTCNTSIYLEGTITVFDDCPACLPPLPPEPPPYELHLRKIKPGYNSPNSCYSTNTIEKINCNFADQVYNAMLVKRYGITVCCEEDLMTWDIKKQLMDLDLLNDPSMCKSTLCHCPDPCFVSAIITLVPTCVAPYLIRATLDPLCYPPVVTSVEITVESSIPCYCYTVEVGDAPVILGYIDCCCKDVIQVIDEVTTINMCAIYPPVSSVPSSINVTSSGLCSDLCIVPPPVCICWNVINTGFVGGQIASFTYKPCDSETPIEVTFSSANTHVCSNNIPVSISNSSPVNQGPCSESCTDIPPACVCYSVVYVGPTCDFVVNSCKTGLGTIAIPSGSFVCSYTIPVPTGGCAGVSDMTITPTGYPCDPLGRCVPPSDCICYFVEMPEGATTPLSCNGVITSFTAPTLGNYYLCTDGPFDPSVTIISINGLCSDPGSPCVIP